MINVRNFLLLIFCLLVIVGVDIRFCVAAEHDWVNSVGEAAADDSRTLADVKREALSKARSQAIEKVAGIKIQGETLVRDFILQADFVASLTSGVILEEKILKWETDTVGKDTASGPMLIYRVFLKSRVALERSDADPSFKISANLNRSVYKSGDNVVIKVKSTSDCYLTIFDVSENNNVYLILPNKYKKNNFIKEGEVFEYPSERDVSKGLTLQAGLLPGSNKAKEMFRIIATKKPISFTPDRFAEGVGLAIFEQETATIGELVKELIAIPAKDRTETFVTYEIVK